MPTFLRLSKIRFVVDEWRNQSESSGKEGTDKKQRSFGSHNAHTHTYSLCQLSLPVGVGQGRFMCVYVQADCSIQVHGRLSQLTVWPGRNARCVFLGIDGIPAIHAVYVLVA